MERNEDDQPQNKKLSSSYNVKGKNLRDKHMSNSSIDKARNVQKDEHTKFASEENQSSKENVEIETQSESPSSKNVNNVKTAQNINNVKRLPQAVLQKNPKNTSMFFSEKL